MGGSSKKVTVGYKYYLGMHMVLCHGPIDFLKWFRVDKRVAWQGVSTGGPIDFEANNLFGGEKREGGVSGTLDLEMGSATQGRNAYLQSQLGNDIPAFRGVVSTVLRQCYLGVNPYLKPWSFRAQRIHVRQNGIPQWHDAKSEIKTGDETPVIDYNGSWDYKSYGPSTNPTNPEALSPPADGYLTGTAPFGNNYSTPYPVATNWPLLTGLWLKKTFHIEKGGVYLLTGTVENAGHFYIDGVYFNSFNKTNADLSSALPFAFYVNLSAGDHTIHALVMDDELAEGSVLNYFYAVLRLVPHNDMNPAHIIRECLTDPDWGMGYQDADIDDASFTLAADTLFNENMGISLLWDRQIPIESFIWEIVKHIDAALYVSRTTGKFVLKLIRQDYDEEALIHLDEFHVVRVDNAAKPTFGELNNSVTVNYWSAETGNDASITVTDTAMVQMQGAVINTTVQYPGFTNSTLATLIAQRDLRSLSSPLLSCTIYADQTANSLNIGDVFKFSWDRWNVENLVMRVTGIAFGDGKTNQVRITCTQDVFDMPTVSVIADPGTGWVDPVSPPSVASQRLVFEVPYYELVQAQGQVDVDDRLSTRPEIGYVAAAASRPGTAINAQMWSDSGSGFEESGMLDFCPTAILSTSVTVLQTSWSVTNSIDLDLVVLGTFFQIGDELCRIDSIDFGTGAITVGRGVLDTIPKPHSAGEILYFWDQYNGADTTEYVDGEVLSVKITPITGQSQLPVESAPADTVTMDSRAARPYPPGLFKVDGSFYPEYIGDSAPLSISWTHRDRKQQTSGTLIDHTAGDIGPESGVSYTVKVYDQTDDLLREVTGITGTTYTYPTATELSDSGTSTLNNGLRVTLQAVRGAFTSLMMYSHEVLRNIAPAITYAFAKLNASDKSPSVTLSGGDLTAARASGSGWATVRSTIGKNRGKWYFEVTNNANGPTTGNAMWGFVRNADSLATYPGNSSLGATSMGWQADNTPDSAKYQNGSLGSVSGYGTVAVGQKAFIAIDLDAGKLWVKNSAAGGWAGGGNPASGTSPTFTFTANTHLHAAIGAYSSPQSATVNFGASAFTGSVPSGFNSGWYAPQIFGTPTYVSRLTMPSTTDAQGVTTDGTHLWFSSSTTIYKYTKAGVLVTSRNVSADAPSGKTQINGLAIKDGILYVSAAENSTPRKAYIVEYNPDTLAYIAHHQITGDWFSEGLAWKDGFWWVCFHANKVIAKVNPTTWTVSATYNLTFNITGSSGGYGSGTGYDGIAWVGNYLVANIHEIYNQDYLDFYYYDGVAFDEVGRLARATSMASQGLAVDPTEANTIWFAERNYSGSDSIAKTTY